MPMDPVANPTTIFMAVSRTAAAISVGVVIEALRFQHGEWVHPEPMHGESQG